MKIELELDPFERKLILKYGHPFSELESQLKDLSRSERSENIAFTKTDIDMVSGQLSISMNHGDAPGPSFEAINALCERLEVYLKD